MNIFKKIYNALIHTQEECHLEKVENNMLNLKELRIERNKLSKNINNLQNEILELGLKIYLATRERRQQLIKRQKRTYRTR